MRGFLFFAVAVFSSPLMAHYSCEGVCKYYASGQLRTSVVSGTGNNQSVAIGSMKNSCSSYCPGYYTGCETISYTCSTPEHTAMYTEAMKTNPGEIE